MKRAAWAATLLAVALALGGALALELRATRADASARALPRGLPRHFAFGVMNAPGEAPYLDAMRTENGTAWDVRYQYLSGGVNTGRGWETWNAPTGEFAARYLDESRRHGYLPAFVYYELFQSRGACGRCAEPRRVMANLANPAVMAAYYDNWKLLMQKVGAFGKPALVIVEPDLWGYVEQASLSHPDGAAAIAASVGGSGTVEAAGLPDTAQGFAWALLRLRDRYAPNALLALHSSPWGTGVDVASSTSRSVDARGLGAREARFLKTAGLAGSPVGISTFDLVSSDVANRDSGQSGIWWDPHNRRFPNFARYLRFVAALSSGTARRVLMWQVPAGNQLFRTQDNTPGHTQDNRAAYVLDHVPALARAGIVGVLFGPGRGGTMVSDARHDGTTNPAPISTYKCARCNDRVSRYRDDDGGYLRLFVGRYYRSGGYELKRTMRVAASERRPPCSPRIAFGESTSSRPGAAPGALLRFAVPVKATCAASGLVDFEVYDNGGRRVWQRWSNGRALTPRFRTFHARWLVPRRLAQGIYTLKVGVFSSGWGRIYGWNDDAATFLATGARRGCTAPPRVTVEAGSASPATVAPGERVALRIMVRASCPLLGLVDFQVYDPAGRRIWQSWRDRVVLTRRTRAFVATWKAPGTSAGTYTVKVGVFGAGWRRLHGWNDRAATIAVSR